MEKIKIPSKCEKCKCVRRYDNGSFARNPHACCELRWVLFKEDYKVDLKSRDVNCPLVKFKDNKIKFTEEVTSNGSKYE